MGVRTAFSVRKSAKPKWNNDMKTPSKLTFETIREAIRSETSTRDNFISDPEGIVMYKGSVGLIHRFLNPSPPYLIEDYRFGMVCAGEACLRANLMEYHPTAGTAMFVTPGTILEPLEVSADFSVYGIGMSSEMFHIINHYRIPEMLNGQLKNATIRQSDEVAALTRRLLDTMWQLLHSADVGRDTRQAMAAVITHHYSDIFSSVRGSQQSHRSSGNTIFDRFLYLINKYAREHHRLEFYADKMCITDRYLGTVVRQVSGVTAKEWIDRAVITAAKVMLKHSDKQIVQISDELCFHNPSFFCKYFKRLVGCTPQEYREG